MQLHHLEMTAIGPYAGTERVDFASLGRAGLFLLEGPTGSGKSTLARDVADWVTVSAAKATKLSRLIRLIMFRFPCVGSCVPNSVTHSTRHHLGYESELGQLAINCNLANLGRLPSWLISRYAHSSQVEHFAYSTGIDSDG